MPGLNPETPDHIPPHQGAWTLHSLREYFVHLLVERDRRYDERFKSQEKMVLQAIDSAATATSKAEVATEKRFESVNEFRQSLADQTASFVTRSELNQIHDNFTDLKTRMDRQEGRTSGINGTWLLLAQVVTIIIASAALIISVVA